MHRDFKDLLQRYPDNLGNYMDDWWVATGDTEEEVKLHRQIVHDLLDRMEEKSYFLKPSKAQFEKQQMEILGWQVGQDGVRIDPSKVAGITQWPRELKNVREVRTTLGVLGYQRPFIRNFAAIARPLHNLTKKDVPFEWTKECKDALEQLITAVTTEPVLYQPNFDRQFELEVDASLFAVGAMLFQRDDEGRRRVISYYSASLNAAERNYDVWDREFLAMIKGLKHNRHLILGSPHKIIVLTDHENLGHYRHPQKINRRVARYLHTLAEYDLELRHIPGSTNKADPLSRRPDHDDGSQDNEEVIALPDALFAKAINMEEVDQSAQRQQDEDPKLCQQWEKVYKCNKRRGYLHKGRALVVLKDQDLRREILRQYHDGSTAGHPGVWKTYKAVREDYWWPRMQDTITNYVKGCATCQQNKTITRRNQPPLQPITSGDNPPFAVMALDFVVKLPESKGYDTILTITDQGCTKATILLPCNEAMGSAEVAELFKEKAFPYTGIPQKLISDRDPRFTSTLFKELCASLDIQHNVSTAYHPQTDGQSERTNQTMEAILRIFCNHQQDNWADWLPIVQYIINSRTSSTTGKAPYELWMGNVPRAHQVLRETKAPAIAERIGQLKEVREHAKRAMQKAQESWVKETNYEPYKEGDRVWLEGTNLHTTHPTRKLGPKRFGPFPVKRVVGPVTYQLELPPQWKVHNVFHAKLLHPYKETEEYGVNFQEPPPDLIDGAEEFEVEQILDERTRGGKKQYLIRWKGYAEAHDSWEPLTNIHAPDRIEDFHQRQKEVQKDKATRRKKASHIRIMSTISSQPPSSANTNERAEWYALHPPHFPLTIANPDDDNDLGPSVSERGETAPSLPMVTVTNDDVPMTEANLAEFNELFRDLDEEIRRMQDISPSIFRPCSPSEPYDISRQLAIRSAGPLPPRVSPEAEPPLTVDPSSMTIDVVQTPSERYTPRTPTPEVMEAGPGPLPLEDNDTIAQSTDTQLTSNPPHPGYPWVRYNRQLHGAPIMLPDQNHGTTRAQFVAHEMESYYGEPSVYAMGEDDRVAHRYPLRAEG
jgi:transposase InsO family protein